MSSTLNIMRSEHSFLSWLFPLLAFTAIVCGVAFCSVDVVKGTTEVTISRCTSHIYIRPYVTYHTRKVRDGDGKVIAVIPYTVDHPAEYYIVSPEGTFEVGPERFDRIGLGRYLRLERKIGKYTGVSYGWQLTTDSEDNPISRLQQTPIES